MRSMCELHNNLTSTVPKFTGDVNSEQTGNTRMLRCRESKHHHQRNNQHVTVYLEHSSSGICQTWRKIHMGPNVEVLMAPDVKILMGQSFSSWIHGHLPMAWAHVPESPPNGPRPLARGRRRPLRHMGPGPGPRSWAHAHVCRSQSFGP